MLEVLDELNSADGEYIFDQTRHKRTFHSVDAGIMFDYVNRKRTEPQGNVTKSQTTFQLSTKKAVLEEKGSIKAPRKRI